jgi:hypothetical protein
MLNRFIFIILFFSSYTSASLIEFEFSGKFGHEFVVNRMSFDSSDSFLGTISYDTNLVNKEQNYGYSNVSHSIYEYVNSAKFSLIVGSNVFESVFLDCSINTEPDPFTGIVPECIDPLTIHVSDNAPAEGDAIVFNSPNMTLNNELLNDDIKIQFSLSFMNSVDHSIFNNSKLPLIPPDPASFLGSSYFSIWSNDGDAVTPSLIRLGGQVDTVKSAQVPEPSTVLIFLSGLLLVIIKYRLSN